MSVVQNPIIGRAKGKVGGVVFSRWKDLNTLRGKPLTVKNPKTDDQVTQRSKFAAAVAYARLILFFLRSSLASVATNMSEFNFFLRSIIPGIDDVDFILDVTTLPGDILSRGSAYPLAGLEADPQVGQAVTVSWTDDSGEEYREATDLVKVIVFNETTNTFIVDPSATLITAETVDTGSLGSTNDVCQVYACVRNAAGDVFSNSQYIAEITLTA